MAAWNKIEVILKRNLVSFGLAPHFKWQIVSVVQVGTIDKQGIFGNRDREPTVLDGHVFVLW